MKHSRNGFAVWRLREGFATSSRALREDVASAEGFEKRPRSLREAFSKPSSIPTEASWSLLEGFARRSWRLHLETIRQIMTSPQQSCVTLETNIIFFRKAMTGIRPASYKQRTLAPSLARAIAVAFPMPDAAPVTSATFSSSLPVMFSLGAGDDLSPEFKPFPPNALETSLLNVLNFFSTNEMGYAPKSLRTTNGSI